MSSVRRNHTKKAKQKDIKENNHRTEFSAEIADGEVKDEAPLTEVMNTTTETENNTSSYSIGWLALALSIASMFVLPQWLGLAGIVLGGAAWFTGTRGLGLWSIVIGAISLALYIILVPYYA